MRSGIQPSPISSTRSRTVGPPPPISTGGVRTGFGQDHSGPKSTNSPWNSASSRVQISRIAATCSSIRAARSRVHAVVGHLLAVPAGPDPELEPATGDPVDARDRLGQHDRVVLGDQETAVPSATVRSRPPSRRARRTGRRCASTAAGSSPPPATAYSRLVGMWVCSVRNSAVEPALLHRARQVEGLDAVVGQEGRRRRGPRVPILPVRAQVINLGAMSARVDPPFRADHVGSLLRPPALLRGPGRARRRAPRRRTGCARSRTTAIRDAVAMQEEIGLQAATDGEFRRTSWHMDFIYQLGGIRQTDEQIRVRMRNAEGEGEFTRPGCAVDEQGPAGRADLRRRLPVPRRARSRRPCRS